jgi:D-glycero-D-manno-heptose 1,7-bisphosphate phosphatase
MDEFRVNEEAVPVLKRLKAAGLLLIATTNQPGLSRGHQSRRELDRMHDLLRATFDLDDLLLCPHDEAHPCFCRRPKPGLLVEASFKWRLNLDYCYVVSDKWQDAEAARAIGCTSLLVESPWVGRVHRDFLGPNLAKVVERILQLQTTQRFSTA